MTEERIKLTKDDFKVWKLADRSHSVDDYMCIANHNPLEVVEQILQDHEIVNRLRELITNYDFNDGLLYEKLQKIMEEKK